MEGLKLNGRQITKMLIISYSYSFALLKKQIKQDNKSNKPYSLHFQRPEPT